MFLYKAEDWTPPFLLSDRNGYALAKAIEGGMQYLNNKARDGLACLTDLDEAPEWRLDELAWESGTWYDYGAPVATKRELLRNAGEHMRRAGTPEGMEMAVRAIYPGSTVEEAADYAGSAFHFRVMARLDEQGHSADADKRLRGAISFFQNARSVLDGVIYRRNWEESAALYAGGALHTAAWHRVECETPQR